MIVAIIASRDLEIMDIDSYLPKTVTEIVSGGAKGIDTCAKKYACANDVRYTEFLPDYKRYGRSAPLKRNTQIINYADEVIAFWDGESRGTKNVIAQCQKEKKKITVFRMNPILDKDEGR